LKRIHGDPSTSLSASERDSLGRAIVDLEQRYFRPAAASAPSDDLSALLDRWLHAASNGHSPRVKV
jgi:hypothetical protein